ncbi:hypothetical protein D3C80_1192900 [compost metagenome]
MQLLTTTLAQAIVDIHQLTVVAATGLVVLVQLCVHADWHVGREHTAVTIHHHIFNRRTWLAVDATVKRQVHCTQSPRCHFSWCEVFVDVPHRHDNTVGAYFLTDIWEWLVDLVIAIQVQQDRLLPSTTDELTVGGWRHTFQELIGVIETVFNTTRYRQEHYFS